MRIGFDAKRALYNRTGLGHYSRNIISALAKYYPEHEYLLYAPKSKRPESILSSNISIKHAKGPLKFINPLWRSYGVSDQLVKDKIDLYHGLSHELPLNIAKTGINSIITIHDLIFIRYPELYKKHDRSIYITKCQKGLDAASNIIAISEQTKSDIVDFFNIEDSRVSVVYQGCNPSFYNQVSLEDREAVRTKYNLPKNYILYVGTIEERKNLLTVVKALHLHNIDTHLVVIGKPTSYYSLIKDYINTNKMKNITFLTNLDSEVLPAIYQMADIFILISLFEGFGIPILEALNSGTPVITSNLGCFPEAGGEGAIYVNPTNIDEVAHSIIYLLSDSEKQEDLVKHGLKHALKFREKEIARNMMNAYKKLF